MTTSVFFLDTPEGKHYSVQVEARELQYADCKYLVYTYQFRMCDLLPATWQEQNCPNCTFHKSDSNFSCKLIFFAKWKHSYAYFCENINTWYDNRLNLNHSMWIQCITLQVVHTNPFNFSHSFTFDSGTWCYCKVPLSLENGDSVASSSIGCTEANINLLQQFGTTKHFRWSEVSHQLCIITSTLVIIIIIRPSVIKILPSLQAIQHL